MLEEINYLHAKFHINILKNKKVISFRTLDTLAEKEKKKEKNEYNRVVTTLKRSFSMESMSRQ